MNDIKPIHDVRESPVCENGDVAATKADGATQAPLSTPNTFAEPCTHESPLVSIIVPVYNAAPYLETLFDSLLRQSYKNLDIICVNDGSTDDSLAILQRYAKNDLRITVVDTPNSGAGSARNTGMQHVRGKYLFFMDSDDFIEGDAVEQLVATAEKSNVDAVVFGIDFYDDTTGTFYPNLHAVAAPFIPPRTVFDPACIDNFYTHLVGFTVNKLYRSSFLLGLKLAFPRIGAHEDMPFTYLALSSTKRVFYLDKTLYHYRRSREGSLSDTTDTQYIFMLEALACMKEGLVERSLWQKHERNFVNYVLHMCLWKHSCLEKFNRLDFRESCRAEWFQKLGVPGHERAFFFEPAYYDFIEDTVHMSFVRRCAIALYRIFHRG